MAKDIDLHPSEWSVEGEKIKRIREPILSPGWDEKLFVLIFVSLLGYWLTETFFPPFQRTIHPTVHWLTHLIF